MEHLAWDVTNAKYTFHALATEMLAKHEEIKNRNEDMKKRNQEIEKRNKENEEEVQEDEKASPDTPSLFLMTDGGLTLFAPESSRDIYASVSNPYNASMYRLSASYRKPQLFIQRFVTDDITPLYAEAAAGAGDFTVSDDEAEELEHELLQDDQEARPLFFKVKPATVHLSSPVVVDVAGEEYVAGVAGVQLGPKFLQDLLMEATKSANEVEWSCASADDLTCYLVDQTGHILASNQVRFPDSSYQIIFCFKN